jgi:2-oxoglutarate ferredoxin oxidoreductase subunit alpha
MTEGVSLAAMLETPVVVHVAQRPGPATGLPTRTEQGDLELVLYAGHGEFPRIIFAPGTLADAFFLTQRAFNLADKSALRAGGRWHLAARHPGIWRGPGGGRQRRA